MQLFVFACGNSCVRIACSGFVHHEQLFPALECELVGLQLRLLRFQFNRHAVLGQFEHLFFFVVHFFLQQIDFLLQCGFRGVLGAQFHECGVMLYRQFIEFLLQNFFSVDQRQQLRAQLNGLLLLNLNLPCFVLDLGV